MPDDAVLYGLHQQVGEMVGEMRSLTAALRDAHTENKDRFTSIEVETRNIKHEMRNHQQVVTVRLEKMDGRVALLDTKVTALESPVKEMMAFRTKMGAAGALLISVGTAAWFLVDPVLRYLSEHVLAAVFERSPH